MALVGNRIANATVPPARLAIGPVLAVILAIGLPAGAQELARQSLDGLRFGAMESPRFGLVQDQAAGASDPRGPSPIGEDIVSPQESVSASPLRDEVDLANLGNGDDGWTLQLLPNGLVYRSYLAGVKEPRLGGAWVHDRTQGWIWDIALGGRVGMLRYGTVDSFWPEGWQIDIEGAGFPRLDLEHQRDLISADFRFGVPITYGTRRFQTKLAYYHLSSHLGDEYMVRHETLSRINYSRDVLVWGNSLYLTPDVRLYGEAAWAFYCDGGSQPWEFQFGLDYSPIHPSGIQGAPFLALNAHLRQDVDFGGNFVVQTGWQWRGESGHLFRAGMEYYNGASDQFEFFRNHEEKIGIGLWYDY